MIDQWQLSGDLPSQRDPLCHGLPCCPRPSVPFPCVGEHNTGLSSGWSSLVVAWGRLSHSQVCQGSVTPAHSLRGLLLQRASSPPLGQDVLEYSAESVRSSGRTGEAEKQETECNLISQFPFVFGADSRI